jgi:hypothetical protein
MNVSEANTKEGIRNANITSASNLGYLASNLTDGNGASKQALLEYFNNATGNYFASPYVVNTSKTGYEMNSTSVNLSINKFLNVELNDTIVPLLNFTNPTPPTDMSTTNLSVEINISITEANLNSFNWNWNGTNYTIYDDSLVLMMNFDNVSALGENGTYVADLSRYGNDGTIQNATNVKSATGKFGKAYRFNGLDGRVASLRADIVVPFNQTFNLSSLSGFAFGAWHSRNGNASNDNEVSIGATNNWYLKYAYQGYLYKGSSCTFVNATGSEVSASFTFASSAGWNDYWHHIICVWNGTNTLIYADGVLGSASAQTITSLKDSNYNIRIGALDNAPYMSLNGTIDEIRIWNRSLSADEIGQMYYSNLNKHDIDKWMFYINESYLEPTGNYNYSYYASARDYVGNENATETRQLNVYRAPNTPSPSINSTDGSNKTTQDLHCFATISDPDTREMNVSVRWYKNNALSLSMDYNENYADDTFFDSVLAYGNLTKGEVWNCSIRLFNGFGYSGWGSSPSLTILNTLPNVTLLSPPDGNKTINRTPTFYWNATDPDAGETLTYDFNISLVAASTCEEPDRHVTGITALNYTLTSDLKCFYDNGDYYIWKVRANDGEEWGSWTSPFKINISSVVGIIMPNNSIYFGSMLPRTWNSTVNNAPAPFTVQNEGNCLVNITIEATNLWQTIANPSQYYKYKADNSSEGLAFNWAGSKTNFTNVPATGDPKMCIAELNYTSLRKAEVDIYVEVPREEVEGLRNSTVTLTAALAE